MRECLQSFETLEKEIQFTIVCESATFFHEVSVGMCHKTVADVDDGFGDQTPACRECTHPHAVSDSRIYAASPRRTVIGPVIQVHIIQFLGTHGIAIQIPSTTTPNRTSWVVICRGKNRIVDELHLRDPGQKLARTELLVERSVAKEIDPCSTRDVAIPHRGNLCDTFRNSEESCVLFKRSYYCWRMEVK